MPVSLIFCSLLWKLIRRSPINASALPSKYINIIHKLRSNKLAIKILNSIDPNNPPTKPSHVLFGLILGAIGFLPIIDPEIYAAVSNMAVLNIDIKNIT